MNWNWDHLRFFLALANTGTLTRASRSIGVSHTTVLRRIKALETDLDTRLFEQTTGGYQLNAAGQALLEAISDIEARLSEVTERVGGADQRIAGPVLITAPDTLSFSILPPMLDELANLYPALNLELVVMNRLVDMPNREADIAIRTCRTPPESLIGRRVGRVSFTPCATSNYIQQQALSVFPPGAHACRFIELDDSFQGTPFHTWLQERMSIGSPRVRVNGFMAAYGLCKAGVGIALLPDYLIDSDPDLQRMPCDSPLASNDVWVLSHADLRNTARVSVVRAFLQEALRKRFEHAEPVP